MSTYQLFKFYPLEREDTTEVSLLKSRYNRLASHLNTHWPMLSVNERVEMSTTIKELEDEIRKHLGKGP